MKALALILFALAVAGCATYYGSRYERASGPADFGYYDVRLDDNRYRVQYRTDGDDFRLAEDFAMRRAAELTLAGRYDWFQIVGRSRRVTDEFFNRYDRSRYYYDDNSYRDRPRYGDGYDDAAVVLEIVMGFNPPPRGSSVYDARRLLDYMRSDGYGYDLRDGR